MAEQTFEQFIAKERERLGKQREDILAKRREIDEQLATIDRELAAITAYENAKSGKTATQPRPRKGGGRKGGVREEILMLIASAPGGLTRGEIFDRKGIVEKENKSGAQSVSNALSAMKRSGQLRQEGNKYLAA